MFQLRLKELREQRGISQQALANAIGEAQSTIGCWESGRGTPRYKTLLKVADYLDVSLDYLTGRTHQQSRSLDITRQEEELVLRYRRLTANEKAMVCRMLEMKP